jgi:hypothetical protein
MDVRVLGPVEASVDGRPIALGGGKPRALLAMLALNAGSAVSAARLVDGLWGERPPGVCPMFCVRSGVTDAALGAGKAIHDQAEDQVQRE